MLSFNTNQLDAMSDSREKQFIKQSVDFLKSDQPNWCEEKPDEDLHTFVVDIKDFAARHSLVNAASIQRLMRLKVKHDYADPLDPYCYMKLTQPGMSEKRRIESFAAALREKRKPIRISLDDDLDAL